MIYDVKSYPILRGYSQHSTSSKSQMQGRCIYYISKHARATPNIIFYFQIDQIVLGSSQLSAESGAGNI